MIQVQVLNSRNSRIMNLTKSKFGIFLWPVFMNSHIRWTVTFVSGTQIINNPWVWYGHNIPPMIKMLNQIMTQCGSQSTGFGVTISRCCPDSLHGKLGHHPANVGCSFFRYTNDDLRNHTNPRRKHKTWAKEDNQLALHCYFRSNPPQRRYWQWIIDI